MSIHPLEPSPALAPRSNVTPAAALAGPLGAPNAAALAAVPHDGWSRVAAELARNYNIELLVALLLSSALQASYQRRSWHCGSTIDHLVWLSMLARLGQRFAPGAFPSSLSVAPLAAPCSTGRLLDVRV